MDYSNRPYMDGPNAKLIEPLEKGIQLAPSYADI